MHSANLSPRSSSSSSVIQIIAIISGSLTFFTSGAQFTWTSPYIPYVSSEDFPGNITFEEASYFTVISPLSFLIFSPIFSKLTDVFGRKRVLLLAAPFQMLVWICIYVSTSLSAFYASRFFVGFSDAVIFSALPAYVGEISDPYIRGTYGNFPSVLMYLGEILIIISASCLDFYTNTIVFSIFPILFFVTYICMPESPHYLVTKGRNTDASKSLSKFHGIKDVTEEMKHLTDVVEQELSNKGSFTELFSVDYNRKALLIVLGARAANQLSGIGAFSTYANYMFKKSGHNLSVEMSAIIFLGSLWIFSTLSLFIQEKIGRRMLMICSCCGCTFSLISETIHLYLEKYTLTNVSNFNWFPLACMIVFIFFFSVGLAIVPQILVSELFAVNVKSKAITITNIFYALCLLSIPKIFQVLTEKYGLFIPFLVFTVCSFCSSIFSFFCIPETQNKSLEEIQNLLKKKQNTTFNHCDKQHV